MRKENEVSFEEVRATFIRENVDYPHRIEWPLGALDVANRQFGRWRRAILTLEDVLSVLLPRHDHGVGLVSAAGSSVLETIQKLTFVDSSNECYARIQGFSDMQRESMVFLSAAPINDPGYEDYKGLLDRGCRGLTHLDGLHRLTAWGRKNRPEVPAYVAG